MRLASEHSPDWISIKRECTKPSTEKNSCSLHYLNALVARPAVAGRWCARIPCTWRFLVWLSLHRSIPPRLHCGRFHSPKCVPLPLPFIAMPPIAFKVQTGFLSKQNVCPLACTNTRCTRIVHTHTHTLPEFFGHQLGALVASILVFTVLVVPGQRACGCRKITFRRLFCLFGCALYNTRATRCFVLASNSSNFASSIGWWWLESNRRLCLRIYLLPTSGIAFDGRAHLCHFAVVGANGKSIASNELWPTNGLKYLGCCWVCVCLQFVTMCRSVYGYRHLDLKKLNDWIQWSCHV